jgi:DNA-binding transcriptional ArsR family regulator
LPEDPFFKQRLIYLFVGTRGAEMRARIVRLIEKKPSNTNQLATELRVDYKAIQHHLKVLTENGITRASIEGAYGALYFITPIMEQYMPWLREIWKESGKT